MEEEQNQTSLVGASENETLMKELAWTSGWADIMMTDLRTAYSIISNVVAAYGIRADNKPHDDRLSLDGMTCMLVGLMDRLDHDFQFKVVKTTDDHPIAWKSISAGVKSVYKQGLKEETIPVDRAKAIEVQPTVEIKPEIKEAVGHLIRNIILSSNQLQNILNNCYHAEKQEDSIYFKVQMDTVNAMGRLVSPKELNIDNIVNEQVSKIIAEMKAKQEEARRQKEQQAQAQTSETLNNKEDAKPVETDETKKPRKKK